MPSEILAFLFRNLQHAKVLTKRRMEAAKHEVKLPKRRGRHVSFSSGRKIHLSDTKNREVGSLCTKLSFYPLLTKVAINTTRGGLRNEYLASETFNG